MGHDADAAQARIVDGEVVLSLAEVDHLATCLAAGLLRRGVQQGSKIGVRMRTRHEWFVVNRAIAKLGGVHVAMNWRQLPAELPAMLALCELDALLFDDEDVNGLCSALANTPIQCLVSLTHPQQSARAIHYQVVLQSDPPDSTTVFAANHLMAPMVFFTSGTSGPPKGVSRANAPQVEDLMAFKEYQFDIIRRRYGLIRHRRELVTLPLHHGMGPMAAEISLRQSAVLFLHRQFDPEAVLRTIDQERITSWSCVPTMLYRIAALPSEVRSRYNVRHLQVLNVGAAALSPILKAWAIDFFGPCVSEGYGMTETGPVTTMMASDSLARPLSCGRPYRHVRIKVMDPSLEREVDAGHQGDIFVKTPFVVKGYLSASNDFDELVTEDGYFKTGDIGYVDAAGYLYITGRKKDVIVSGGVKVFPREIEDVLERHESVLAAAVIGVPDAEFGERVVAVCEARPGYMPSDQDIQLMMDGLLSGYKRPRYVHFVQKLPRNDLGKILKEQLRKQFAIM